MTEFTHKGIAITVNASGNFVCNIEDSEYRESTLQALKDKIDKQLKSQIDIAKSAPLGLAVTGVLRDGGHSIWAKARSTQGVITGINRTTGNLLIRSEGVGKEWSWIHVLVDTPENRELVSDLASTINHENELLRNVNKISVKISRAYGNVPHDKYLDLVSSLEKEYQDKATTLVGA